MFKPEKIIFYLLALLTAFGWGKVVFESNKIEYIEVEKVIIEPFTITNHKKYQLAIAMTESELNPYAIGKTNDFGVFQVTPIWCAEINRILGEDCYTHTDAFDLSKSIEMFNIMYNGKSLDEIIKIHNPNAPKSYSNKVYSNLQKVNILCEILAY